MTARRHQNQIISIADVQIKVAHDGAPIKWKKKSILIKQWLNTKRMIGYYHNNWFDFNAMKNDKLLNLEFSGND